MGGGGVVIYNLFGLTSQGRKEGGGGVMAVEKGGEDPQRRKQGGDYFVEKLFRERDPLFAIRWKGLKKGTTP